jgi:hypothetical protein
LESSEAGEQLSECRGVSLNPSPPPLSNKPDSEGLGPKGTHEELIPPSFFLRFSFSLVSFLSDAYLAYGSVVAFTVNLEEHHNHNLSQAYAIATSQFSHLRAINEHAARAALHEAEHYGADLKGGILVRSSLHLPRRSISPPRHERAMV